jgi:hypothetical protein
MGENSDGTSVSLKKLEANRRNAKRSTGPRTERGKKVSKLNALRTGLFAKHVVIPVCDGDGSGEQFGKLLADLQKEFQPEGPSEEFWVVQIAECMWRLRRATWAEKGSVQNAANWNGKPPSLLQQVGSHRNSISIVQRVQKEISDTGTLSPSSYERILPMLRIYNSFTGAEETYSSTEPMIDPQLIASLNWMIVGLEKSIDNAIISKQQREEDYYAENALPPETIMNKILRYERSVQRKLDWALQKLLESQQRRKNRQSVS